MKIIKRFKFAYMFLSFLLVITCGYNAANASTTAPSKIGGVNFGGVFTLEDWFFSNKAVGHDVMTSCADSKTGIASSQLFTGNTSKPDFRWSSETDLIKKLHDQYESPEIAEIFQKHRSTYLSNGVGDPTLSTSFAKAAAMGIKIVRLPITWAIQYDKPYTIIKADGKTQEIPATNGKVQLIQDPFYPDKQWASIPISQIKAILEAASYQGIRVILDIHTLPGGASDGTYNGVWPDAPRFWSVAPATYQKNFSTIFDNLVDWANSLGTTSDAFKGLEGLTPMNEPAHMMGSVASSNLESLKINPDPKKITVCSAAGAPVSPPDGKSGITSWAEPPYNGNILSPKDILNTLGLAVTKFRTSGLGASGVKLYMNIIETMYDSSTPKPFDEIGKWWRGDAKTGQVAIASLEERMKWAVLDIHHYVAWSPDCNNILDPKYVPAGERDSKDRLVLGADGKPIIYYADGVLMLIDSATDKPVVLIDPETKKLAAPPETAPLDTKQAFLTSFDNGATYKDFFPTTYLTKDTNGGYKINTKYGFGQIRSCSGWFSTIRKDLGMENTAELLAASEFSAGTNENTWRSGASGKARKIDNSPMNITNSNEYRNTFIGEQVQLAHDAKITAIFWTWAIPYNSNYQNEWAFSSICSEANKALLPGICSSAQ